MAHGVWIERRYLPGVICEVCGKWAIPTTHATIDLPDEVATLLDNKYNKPVDPSTFGEVLKILPEYRIRLYPGAALGKARIIKLSGELKNEFAWGTMTPILNKVDFSQFRSLLGGHLAGQEIQNLESYDKLIELIRTPIDLGKLYHKRNCDICGDLAMNSIDENEVSRIASSASKGHEIYEVPGGHLLVSDQFKKAVEQLGLRNASFKEFVVEDYLKKFQSAT